MRCGMRGIADIDQARFVSSALEHRRPASAKAARDHGAALVVTGQPGIGIAAVLDRYPAGIAVERMRERLCLS
jgi:hypothetical protein